MDFVNKTRAADAAEMALSRLFKKRLASARTDGDEGQLALLEFYERNMSKLMTSIGKREPRFAEHVIHNYLALKKIYGGADAS